MTQNQVVEMHNTVTQLHKLTNEATKGTAIIDWPEILQAIMTLLGLMKTHCESLKLPTQKSEETKKPTDLTNK